MMIRGNRKNCATSRDVGLRSSVSSTAGSSIVRMPARVIGQQ